jgi:hypothetical protein
VATGKTAVNSERFNLRTFCPGGKLPPSTAGRDACRYILKWHIAAPGTGALRVSALNPCLSVFIRG